MIGKPLADITASDIDLLITNQVQESRTLDYKERLPGNNSDDKKEFLADVSSFANAIGGDLIYGIREERDGANRPTGIPAEIVGVGAVNLDESVLRLENLVRDTIDPRLPSFQIRLVYCGARGVVLILRILQSWHAPHMNKRDWRFYSRHSAGKYALDASEIRSAFLQSENLTERIRRFHDERLARVIADATPTVLPAGTKLVLHVLPRSMGDLNSTWDFRAVVSDRDLRQKLGPMATGGWSSRYNLDGFLTYVDDGYLQLYRTGAIEVVLSAIENMLPDGIVVIPGDQLVSWITNKLEEILELMNQSGVVPPIFIFLSVLGARGYRLATGRNWMYTGHPVDRDILHLPELSLETYPDEIRPVLLPALDALWQSAGYSQSPYHDRE